MIPELRTMIGRIREHVELEKIDYEGLAHSGADTGVSGFTHTKHCVDFYEENEEAIYDLLREGAHAHGHNVPEFIGMFNNADMADDPEGRKVLLSWYAAERTAHRLTDSDTSWERCPICTRETIVVFDHKEWDHTCRCENLDAEEIETMLSLLED